MSNRHVNLAGQMVACPCHACAFFRGGDEENAVLLPFMAEGIAVGDKCVNIIDGTARQHRLEGLASVGIDVVRAEQSGQLELRPWEQAQAAGGRFDMEGILRSWNDAVLTPDDSFRLTRFWSNMEWALQDDLPGVEDLVEYESRFNDIYPKSTDVFVCAYDTTKFDVRRLVQVFCAHPFVIVGGIFVENPFYIPPAAWLGERGRDPN
jgi:hypothetical protein